MIPKIDGPHLEVRLVKPEGLQSLDYAPSLATELIFEVAARDYSTEAEALIAYDDYIATILAKLGPAWYAETYRPLTYGNPLYTHYYNPAYGVGGRLIAAPRLADPRDLGARIAAYEALCAALERPDVSFSALPLVDWVTMPIIRDWQRTIAVAALAPNVPSSWRRQYDSAMSGPWATLRGLRRGLLIPWFSGARPTRNRELFTALHAGLADDLSYLVLCVAGGSSATIERTDAPLLALAQEAEGRKLVRLVSSSWQPGSLAVFRSRRVAIKISNDEPLISL